MQIKYLGSAHRRTIPEGTDFGGQIKESNPTAVVFDLDSGHVVDTSDEQYSDVPDAFWTRLIEDADFADVSDQDVRQTSRAEELWRGRAHVDAPATDTDTDAPARPASGSEVSTGGDVSTVGGSTDAGDTPAGGGTTTGGSTRGTKGR